MDLIPCSDSEKQLCNCSLFTPASVSLFSVHSAGFHVPPCEVGLVCLPCLFDGFVAHAPAVSGVDSPTDLPSNRAALQVRRVKALL